MNLDNGSALFKGTFSQDITDNFGFKLSAGTSASEKFNTELQINWKIVNNIAVYVKGGYAQIDYDRLGLTDKYGNVWSGGIGLEWTFGGAAVNSANADDGDKKQSSTTTASNEKANNKSANRKSEKLVAANLLQEVAKNPAIRSARVNAAVDQSTTRLVSIDKTLLPAGASINPLTGDISVAVTAGTITAITKNGGAFTNTGQFAIS